MKQVIITFDENNDIVNINTTHNDQDRDIDVVIFDPEKFYAQTLREFIDTSCNVRTGYLCPKCGKELSPSDIDGYDFQCYDCDEDFYLCEAIERED